MAGHRVVVLQTIELVVKSKIEDIGYTKIKTIISLASDEMTRSKVVDTSSFKRIRIRIDPWYSHILYLWTDFFFLYCFYCNSQLCFFFSLQEVVPDWQQTASNILVAVGNKYINEIMEDILGKFQPGVLPHYFVVQTLASLSDSNGTYFALNTLRVTRLFAPI